MKKLVTFLMAASIVFSFAACGQTPVNDEITSETTVAAEAETTVKETTMPAETTEKQGAETTKEVTTITAVTTTKKPTETTTKKHVVTTTKKQETTTKKPVTTTKKDPVTTTKKPVTTTKKAETTTKKPVTTTNSPTKNEDLSVIGKKRYGDMARAGLIYDKAGKRSSYNKISEGEEYYIYDSNGNLHNKVKPYSKGNEPSTVPFGICEYCGKNMKNVMVNGHYESACAHGGCKRWLADVTCPDCGKKVPANTCHTCKKSSKAITGFIMLCPTFALQSAR